MFTLKILRVLTSLLGISVIFFYSIQKVHANSISLVCGKPSKQILYPAKNLQGIYQVGVGIVPLNVTKFNLKESSVEVDFYLTIEYQLQHKVNNVKCVGDDAKDVWKNFYNPDVEFMNIPNPEFMQGSHWLVSDNRFIYMTRVKGTASIDGNFRQYPFDSIKIVFTASGEDNNSILELNPSSWYHPDLGSLANQMKSVRVPGWRLKDAKFKKDIDPAVDGTGTWSLLSLELDLARISMPVVVRSGIPLILLYLVALLSLRLPPKFLDARVGTQAAVLLALFAYSVYFIDSIPPTDYLTFGDLTWLLILISIFMIIMSEALGHIEPVKQWELYAKKILPIFSLLAMLTLLFSGVVLFNIE
jgi:hypothetical protein